MRLNLRQLPPLDYTLQNVSISLGTIVTSVSSLALTLGVALPLSVIRAFSEVVPKDNSKKSVLIIGASSGIGLEVVKKYAAMNNTTIIAASSNAEKLRSAISSLGDTRAIIEIQPINLKSPTQDIKRAIEHIDSRFGPITHLYSIAGISNHLDEGQPWGLDVTEEIIKVNVAGTVAAVLTAYELMKPRSAGKICMIGSTAGFFSPANMISYASSKAFINTFAADLRCIAQQDNIEVVNVAPGFIRSRMTDKMLSQQSTTPNAEIASTEGMAKAIVDGVERGGIDLISWPWRQTVLTYALQSVNPICGNAGRLMTCAARLTGKKIT